MKKIAAMLMLTLFVIACSSTKNDLKMSHRRIPTSGSGNHGSAVAAVTSVGESQPSINSPASAPMYVSTKKIITVQESASINTPTVVTPAVSADKDGQDAALDQKVTLAQMEMFRQIEIDKAISTVGLKKVMQRKVYTTEVRTLDDSTSSSAIVSRDTVFSAPESGEWHPVE